MSQINNPPIPIAAAIAHVADFIGAYQPSDKICRREILIDPIDQLDWLAAQSNPVKVFGANQDNSAVIAGIGQAIVIKGKGQVSYKSIFRKLRSYLSPQYPYLQWYGGFCFDHRSLKGTWQEFGAWRFVVPSFELASDGKRMMFCCNLVGKISKRALLKELEGLGRVLATQALDRQMIKRRDQPSSQRWRHAVATVLNKIKQGICQKVVLARQTVFTFDAALNPWQVLKTLKYVTPHSYHFAFAFGDSVFLGASPERLYKRQGRSLLSEALAGTNKATDDPALLLESAKNRLEHQIVVEAIRESLRPLSDALSVDAAPQIRQLTNNHHLNTGITATLKDGVMDEDILQSLHPTPALGGYPRDTAKRMINALEPFGRGWYGGPIGYVGLDWAEFVVGIRSGLIKGKMLSVYAGAGIVAGSDPDDEWDEIENKIGNFIKIIQ